MRKNDTNPEFRFSPRANRAGEINWQSWNDTAFATARRQDKLVFLAISAVWCHWCHVMDETTYSDPKVIKKLNSEFVPIRVDSDQRPDVNRRYNQGGWPTFAILVPSGEILVGGTYIVPSELDSLLAKVKKYYSAHSDEIELKIEEVQQERAMAAAERPPAAMLSERIVGDIVGLLKDAYDQAYGGFDRAPKFPQFDALDFLLENYYRTKDKSLLEMASNTLNHMMAGLQDQVAGGFFRYSTTRDWSVPHYEKMLEDNAHLIILYLKASQIAHEKKYEEVARRTMSYLTSTLLDRNTGCFAGSQDAEEEFYILREEERQKRKEPFVDPIIYTDWNSQAATAFLNAYWVFGDEEALLRALHILDFLWSNCRHEVHGMYHYWDGQPHLLGCLPDQVGTGSAMLNAYETTGRAIYLQQAERLAEHIRRDFYDENGGGFFDLARGEIPGSTGRLVDQDKSVLDNAAAADFFLALHTLTGKDEYHDLAEQALKAFLDDYQQYGPSAALYARAIDHFLQEPVKVTVVGRQQNVGTRKLLREALKVYAPATVVELLDPTRDKDRVAALGHKTGAAPAAYVCHKQTCSPPIEAVEDLAPTLDSA